MKEVIPTASFNSKPDNHSQYHRWQHDHFDSEQILELLRRNEQEWELHNMVEKVCDHFSRSGISRLGKMIGQVCKTRPYRSEDLNI